MIKLNVSAANIAVEEKETLTEGRVGLLCQFRFTGEWTGLAKTAVFDGADSRDVILKSDTVAIPAECLAAEGYSLSVGVYGKNAAGDIVIPTVYATVGKIQRSAYPSGREGAAPTPDVVAQIQQAAANAEELARSVREDADLGKFNGGKGEKGEKGDRGNTGPAGEAGGFYTPAVTQPDANTMRMSFIPSKVGMPAVAETDITLPAGGGGGGSSIAIDETLTKSGQAADAKTVGDRLDSLSEEIVTTSESKVAAHNTGTDTHSDIRLLIQGLTDRLNALADSDDTTLDQLSEVVAYIKSNRSLIEAITTSKVSVADIVDNLTTNVSNKPLSAAQGVVIKALIDALRNDKLDAAELTNAVNTALAQAKASGEFDGAEGKSAYQYAQEGGYTGTEAEFAEKLAQEQLTGTTSELTPTQVYEAVSAGIPVKVQYTDRTYGLLSFTAFNVAESLNVIVSQTIVYYNGVYILAELFGNKSNNTWGFKSTMLAQKTDIPSALPNPNALTFTGAVTGSYDGSAPLKVEIPSGGGGEWETAIDTTLEEAAALNTGEMLGKTEMLCVFAVPKSDSNVILNASSAAFGRSLNGFAIGSASYGKIGFIYAKKICGHAIAYVGSSDTTSTNPGLETTPRTGVNATYYRITAKPTDIPLKLTIALPMGTIIKVFVR